MAKSPIEKKVRAAWAASTIVGSLIVVLNATLADSNLLGSLPPWVQAIVILAGTLLGIGYPAWRAPHTPRSDPDAQRTRGPGVGGYGGL